MTVIDKILNEWSFRCHDGIVDMKDPNKVVILNEILAGYNLNEQEEYNIDSLEKILLSKNIPDQISEYIILKVEKRNQVDKLAELINSVSLNSLRGKDESLQVGDLSWLNNITGVTSKSLAIGKGEILLVLMIKEAKLDLSDTKNKDTKADLNVSGRKVEIKQSSETGGAIISKSGRSGGYKVTWTPEFKNKWNLTKALSTWTPIYDRFNSLSTKEERKEFIDDINNLITNHGFDPLPPPQEIPQNNPEKFYKLIASLVVKDYLDNKDLILMNNNLDYVTLDDKEQILNNPDIRANSAFIPRIFYKETPVDESVNIDNKLAEELSNSILELFNTDHFQLRVDERGNVLDVLNLNKIPLKDYKPAEVKEKLKADISGEIKGRAERILGKDIPSSATNDVGIKVLKPVLVVDGEKYPLLLLANSTKEIKDKEGNVKEVVEVENKGTLYFATVVDNKATTLLLLNKEDDNDLYFQIKQHSERKTGEEKEPKILTPSNYIYEIDLNELMGKEKEEQTPVLIDPASLPYKIRTDYRTGANFEHNQYGTGKIVATSAGSGGKGDSRGKLDWIDVKYPKQFLKGGKLTDIRRFNDIFTLASPSLAK